VEAETQPVAEVAKPVAEVAKPVAEVAKPVAEVAKPVAKSDPTAFVSAKTPEIVERVKDAIETDVTDPSFPVSTKHAATKEIRERLGIGGVNSKTRQSDEQAQKEAIKQNIPGKARRLADEINETPRPLTNVEEAGLKIKIAQLEIEHEQAMKSVEKATDPSDIQSRSAEANRIEQEFDLVMSALEKAGSEAGRAFRQRRVGINRSFKLTSVLNRAKAAKKADLTPKSRSQFKTLTSELEKANERIDRLAKEVQEFKARRFVRRGRAATEFKRMTKQQKDSDLSELVARTNALLKQGCNN
jgi:hypothetical protein